MNAINLWCMILKIIDYSCKIRYNSCKWRNKILSIIFSFMTTIFLKSFFSFPFFYLLFTSSLFTIIYYLPKIDLKNQ